MTLADKIGSTAILLFIFIMIIAIVRRDSIKEGYESGYSDAYQTGIDYERQAEQRGYTDAWQFSINYGGPHVASKN